MLIRKSSTKHLASWGGRSPSVFGYALFRVRPASFFYEGSEMRPLAFLSLLLVLGVSCYAQNPSASKGIRTKIEATELDRRMRLENLNTHDQDHYMRFELAESDYDYRIVFSTGQGMTQFHVRIL
jgi:hypothetical protein